MPTIIDSLIVELGIDPSKFMKGKQEALNETKKLEQQQLASAKNIEYGAGRANDAFKELRTSAITAFAAITGSRSLVEFAANAVHVGAAAGRLSRNLNIPVETISRWQSLAKVFGGSPEGMASSFTEISDALAGWKIGDVRAIVAEYRQLGAVGGTIIDINKGVEQSFLDIVKNIQAIHDKDPALAGYWGRRLNIDPGLYDAMISKTEKFNDLLRQQNALTKEQAENAGKVERRWLTFTENATRGAQGFILDLVDSDSKFNPFKNGSDAKDWEMIKGWYNKIVGTSQAKAATSSGAPIAPSGGGAFTSQAEKEQYIRAAAAKRGINPNVAMAVAKSEGFNNFVSTIPGETSYGAFQLHVTPGGRKGHLGDQFVKDTGLDPSNPANERASIDFALDDARRNGWKAFHGAKNTGIGQWAGIDRGGGGSTSTTTVQINGPININAGAGADGVKIANDFRNEILKRQSDTALANTGNQ